jgi:hypothetical protein
LSNLASGYWVFDTETLDNDRCYFQRLADKTAYLHEGEKVSSNNVGLTSTESVQ